ncbi:MAG: hypothetical protein ABR549_04815 [Mycobacteriales bacterium]
MRSPLRRAERAVAAAIALQLLLAVPSALALGPSGHASEAVAANRAQAVRQADADRALAVRALLACRAEAVLDRDKAAFLADLDPTQRRFLAQQSAVFDNLTALRFSGWRYELDVADERPHTPALDAARGTWWAPRVALRYSIAGYDRTPTQEEQGLTFVQRQHRWYLASDSDFASSGHPSQRNLWDTGTLRVTRGRFCLVLAHPAGAGMAALAQRECDAAVPRVTAVWGTDWLRRVVLVVPDTATELKQLVPDVGDLSNIAAVATAELFDPGTGYHPVGDRVIVNPKNFRRLGPVGRRVVLTHEVTHVASRGVTGPHAPTWFVEGLADYVGFLHVDIPLSLSASELRKAMRAGHIPTALPADSAFSGGRADLAATYEQSWLAVTLIAERYGRATMLKLYRDIGTGTRADALDVAFAKDLHTTVGAFTRSWTASLKHRLL